MILLYSLVVIWFTWTLFVAVMHLKRVRDKWGLTMAQKIFGYPALFIGYSLDVALNLTVFSIVFVDFPVELTVSARLERYIGDKDWREDLAVWIREDLLADFDPDGSHGKPGR